MLLSQRVGTAVPTAIRCFPPAISLAPKRHRQRPSCAAVYLGTLRHFCWSLIKYLQNDRRINVKLLLIYRHAVVKEHTEHPDKTRRLRIFSKVLRTTDPVEVETVRDEKFLAPPHTSNPCDVKRILVILFTTLTTMVVSSIWLMSQ